MAAFTTLPLRLPSLPPRRPRTSSPTLTTPTPPSVTDSLRLAVSNHHTTQIPTLVQRCLSHPPLDPTLWREAVTTCLNAHDITSAEYVLRLGIDSLPNLPRRLLVRPLLTLAKRSRWRIVLSLLDLLQKRGQNTAPDERLLVSLANVATDKRAYNVALHLLSLAKTYGFALSAVGYSVLLKTHGRMRNASAVRAVAARVEREEMDVDSVLLNSAVDALVRVDDLRGAQHLLTKQRFYNLADAATYNTLIKGLSRDGRVREAFDCVRTMRDAGLQPNEVTRNTLLNACVTAGDLDGARRLADVTATQELPGEGADDVQLTIALTALIGGLAESGRIEEAEGVLRDMKRRGAKPSDVTYSALIKACFACGSVEEAERVFESVPEELKTVGVCNAFVRGLCKTGDMRLVRKARGVVEGMKGRVGETFNVLLDGLVGAGLFEEAEEVLGEMQEVGFVPSIVSYTILMKGYADAGLYGKAKKMFKEISERGVKMDRVALNAFLATCARGGDVRAALKVLGYMEEKGGAVAPGVYSYTPVLGMYLRKGDLELAWGIYERMRGRGVLLNAYVVELVATHLVGWEGGKERKSLALAKVCVMLLRDALEDGVERRVLRKWRRRMLAVFAEPKAKAMFDELDWKELRSASETIFENHGWNDIDSGWRVL